MEGDLTIGQFCPALWKNAEKTPPIYCHVTKTGLMPHEVSQEGRANNALRRECPYRDATNNMCQITNPPVFPPQFSQEHRENFPPDTPPYYTGKGPRFPL